MVRTRSWFTIAVLLGMRLVWAEAAPADSPPTQENGLPADLSGRWQASPLTESWGVKEWGPACGPRPTGTPQVGGLVEIEQRGAELNISGLGRNFSSQQCWEQFPGLSPATHTASPETWRTICRTPPSDPRQARVTTTLSATPDVISLSEVGEYQFSIKEQVCVASVRRSRSYRLLEPKHPRPPKPMAKAEPASSSETEALSTPTDTRCASPGPPARLEIRPSRKLLRAGDSFRFAASVLDANNCNLNLPVRWELGRGQGLRMTLPGAVQTDADAPEQEVTLTAKVDQREVRALVEIATKERYEALLADGNFDSEGNGQSVSTSLAHGAIGAQETVAVAEQGRGPLTWALLGAGSLLAVGGLGILLGRRRGRARKQNEGAGHAGPSLPPRALVRKICPLCGTQYPPDAVFCGTDGAALLPLN